MTARAERATRIGELVGAKYRIVRMLAEGGMGVVYEAQHTVVRRRFAVKFLRPDLADRRDILNRFQREAEAAGALESEHVAAAVDFGIVPDGTPYIVMEYLVGESLAALLEREGRLPVSRAADLVSQAARGIQVAHVSGIIHRDLKPQNLFVCRRQDGTDLLKILDFGVAKLQAIDEMNASTRTGTVLGTVAYMSPEQARGDKVVDQRSDVYALGAILYELVSQKKPHPGESHNAVLHHISTQPAVPLGSVQPGLPAGFMEVVACALSSDPEARPPSAEALAQALVPFAERSVWPAPKREDSGSMHIEVSSTPRAAADEARRTPPAAGPPAATADDRVATPATHPPRRRRVRPLVATGVAIAVVALVVALRLRNATPPPQRGAGPAAGARGGAAVVPATDPTFGLREPTQGAPLPIATTSAPAAQAGPNPHPSGGASGGALARTAHRYPSSARPSASPASSDLPARSPGSSGKAAALPITFDQENPYK